MKINSLTFLQKVKIFSKLTPFVFGEALFMIGVFLLITNEEWYRNIDGLILTIIGLGIVGWKLMKLMNLVNSAENGVKCIACVILNDKSNLEHNGRKVINYAFEYKVEGKSYTFFFNSAYKRELVLGSKFDAYVDLKKGKHLFIPKLYGLDCIE